LAASEAAPTAAWLRRRLLDWVPRNGRDFPWRRNPTPYNVLIAELLLHRTRADLVPPLFHRFLAAYPNPHTLARAESRNVAALLRPLGFAHRARRLPELGRALVERHAGKVPASREELLALPGVGPYIANAVLAVAFARRMPLLDPNVIRVIGRVFGFHSERIRPRDDPRLWAFVRDLVPPREPGRFGLALVDLGALVCRSRRPRCFNCPLSPRCRAFRLREVEPAAPSKHRAPQPSVERPERGRTRSRSATSRDKAANSGCGK
jgi:A/G-specific adenine glycosylase